MINPEYFAKEIGKRSYNRFVPTLAENAEFAGDIAELGRRGVLNDKDQGLFNRDEENVWSYAWKALKGEDSEEFKKADKDPSNDESSASKVS